MSVLSSELRNRLAQVVTEAREVAEEGARVALESLAVHHHEPYRHMSPEGRELRNRLRAHGRHLGDRRGEKTGAQTIEHLVQECAYEHWHRMLFARFLAENHLLIEPEMKVPITLEECEELAKEEGADQWTLASRFAQHMLPQVFRADHPVFGVTFAREHRGKLEGLLESLPPDVFKTSDSLGWVYQFWQADKKEQVNRSEVKIGADELPAVTQLFTEPYMVQFLLHNSLGAWWVTRHPGERCPVDLTYLRYAPSTSEGKGETIPAAGTFDAWPNDLSKLKLLDPCCGSGHFLVAAFLMLVPIRMGVEGLSARDAVDTVLLDNLHGLEIDQRCIEIAAFALALEAWRYPDAGGYRPLPPLNLAWCGQPLPYKEDEWLKLANGDDRLRVGMHALYTVFRDAPLLGSLIDPRRVIGDLITADYGELRPLLIRALTDKVAEPEGGYGGEQEALLQETAISAQGMAQAAELLSRNYDLVVTNVPYLSRGKQSIKLKQFCERRYPNAKNDLANVFLERCLELCREGGATQIVMPQNWLFLGSYRELRKRLLKADTFNLMIWLGAKAFQTPLWDFNIQLLTITRTEPPAAHQLSGIDVSEARTAHDKATELRIAKIKTVSQMEQLHNPDARITLDALSRKVLLADYADSYVGFQNGDSPRFIFEHWEIRDYGAAWEPFQMTTSDTTHFAGRCSILRWEGGTGAMREYAYVKGTSAWNKHGVAVRLVGDLPCSLYNGYKYDQSSAAIIPRKDKLLPAIWCFCSSPEFNEAVREIDRALKVTNATLVKVAFDLEHWQRVALERYTSGLPKPYSDDPTQWIFHGHPKPATSPLQVAVARLLGYRWPSESDNEMELSDDARAWIDKAKKLDKLSDNDGIVCLAAIHGELPAHERLLRLLEAAWGDEWNAGVLSKLLADADCAGKTLEIWLRDKFFEQHCALFHQRPFIWHIWDGLKDGFAALLNYHMLDRTNLERLIYSYLGDWIRMQEQAKRDGEDGAEERLTAAQGLKKRLEAILKGEDPLDIFVRWKPIERQPVGWEPDLNDGVRLNIRPFILVDDVSKKGAGILRVKPSIDWKKDRGKDVPDSPWYRHFKGERINDWHLKLAEKEAAGSSKGLEN